ncbi:histidine triad nucleotide-binding protein [Nocardioides limicola]|uniref:histidine triad nucleotide-binding protein n=1 Tax=Nocardioides limicola TaxID=2803368 RepID=UPI00193BF8B8|nr:histidine triad nucleotide-binding protein [Nocardioides sp. DJM-14]
MTPPAAKDDCLFCRIVKGEVPADVVHAGETTIAFRDINPQAPTHVLVIPSSHYANIAELAQWEPGAVTELFATAAEVAESEGLGDQYRLVFNTGAEAGQAVFHTHMHVLGGRPLNWPPG